MSPIIRILVPVAFGAFGVLCLVKPLVVLRLYNRWPKFISSILGSDAWLPPSGRKALRLIDADPSAYARVYWYSVLVVRLSGVVALLIFFVSLLIAVATFGNWT